MSQSNQQTNQATDIAGLVGQIGCVTGFASLLVIGLAFFAGRFLDSLLGTEPIFTILFLLGSFPITLYVIVRISMAVLNRAQARAMTGGDHETKESLNEEKPEA